MSTAHTNDSYQGYRQHPQRYGSPDNYGEWFDDFAPVQPGQPYLTSRSSASVGKRTQPTAAVAAVGASAIAGLVAFNLNGASSDPAASTVYVPYPSARWHRPSLLRRSTRLFRRLIRHGAGRS